MAENIDSLSILALARLRGSAAETEIESCSGPAISTVVAAERLSCSPRVVRNMIGRNELICYRTENDKTKIRLPLWQFQAVGGPHTWVAELVDAYGANGWALLNFVTAPRKNLAGGNYLQLLQSERTAEVLKFAKRSNPD